MYTIQSKHMLILITFIFKINSFYVGTRNAYGKCFYMRLNYKIYTVWMLVILGNILSNIKLCYENFSSIETLKKSTTKNKNRFNRILFLFDTFVDMKSNEVFYFNLHRIFFSKKKIKTYCCFRSACNTELRLFRRFHSNM